MFTLFWIRAIITSMSTIKKTQRSSGGTSVLSFRIPDDQRTTLNQLAATSLIVGVHSGEQLARQIVTDFIAGKIRYPQTQQA